MTIDEGGAHGTEGSAAARSGDATAEDLLFAAPGGGASASIATPAKTTFEDDDAWAPLPDRMIDDFDLGALIGGAGSSTTAASATSTPTSPSASPKGLSGGERAVERGAGAMPARQAAPMRAQQPKSSSPVPVRAVTTGPKGGRTMDAAPMGRVAPSPKTAARPAAKPLVEASLAPPVAGAEPVDVVDLERARARPPFRLGLPLWIGATGACSMSYAIVFPGSLLLAAVAAAMGLTAGLFLQTLLRK